MSFAKMYATLIFGLILSAFVQILGFQTFSDWVQILTIGIVVYGAFTYRYGEEPYLFTLKSFTYQLFETMFAQFANLDLLGGLLSLALAAQIIMFIYRVFEGDFRR